MCRRSGPRASGSSRESGSVCTAGTGSECFSHGTVERQGRGGHRWSQRCIGRAVALALAAESMKVVVADIEQPPLDETVAEIESAGGIASGVLCDVSDWESVDALRARCTEEFGPADVVMNNAGVAGGGSISAVDLKAWEWTLAVNLWGVIYGVKAFLPAMIERGEGHIVNTASIAGHRHVHGHGRLQHQQACRCRLQRDAATGDARGRHECRRHLSVPRVRCLPTSSTVERNRQERYRDPGPDLDPDGRGRSRRPCSGRFCVGGRLLCDRGPVCRADGPGESRRAGRRRGQDEPVLAFQPTIWPTV